MIHVTRLNHVSVILNSDLIEYIEVTPDTVISLTTGQKLMVLEPAEEIISRVVAYRRLIHSALPVPASLASRNEAAKSSAELDIHGTT
jgi:flagellar protein FlbD